MDIPALAMASSQAQIMTQVNVAVLANNLSTMETIGDNMVKIMEQSVTPNLGANIDITV